MRDPVYGKVSRCIIVGGEPLYVDFEGSLHFVSQHRLD
jgi:hypothetical protein